MKKYLLSGFFILAFVVYVAFQHIYPSASSSLAAQTVTASGFGTNAGQYKDGTYTGSVVSAFYGNVQVAAIISGGKLTDVKFLQYPSDRTTSQQIDIGAMPKLTSEAISSQSANVDTVSGATQLSSAFSQSLGTALSQA